MRILKRYSNRKLYDTSDKRYLTIDEVGDLVASGEDIQVVDKETGIDMTSVVLSQVVLERERKRGDGSLPSAFLAGVVRAGRDYASQAVQSAARAMIGELIAGGRSSLQDRLRKLLPDRVLNIEDARHIAELIYEKALQNKDALERLVDERAHAVISRFQLPTREEVDALTKALEELERKIDAIPIPATSPRRSAARGSRRKTSA